MKLCGVGPRFANKLVVWVDEAPTLEPSGGPSIRWERSPAARRLTVARTIVVELMTHGGRSNYGVVGGSFQPDGSGLFRANVLSQPTSDAEINWSLGGEWPMVTQGITDANAVDHIVEALRNSQVDIMLGSGELTLDKFVESGIASSPRFFCVLTLIFSELMAKREITEDLITQVAQAALTRNYG